ncbi:MAG: FAD-dependent oxidoreductase [bacterium]
MTHTADKPIFRIEAFGRRMEFNPVEESPCRHACPAGIDVKRYVGQIGFGDFAGALATIRKHMPFPSACGRVCLHPCETECERGKVDSPIAIMHLKRFVSDYESRRGIEQEIPAPAKSTGKKVAIIGSGPSGLTSAHDLALQGHKVVVFERAGIPGGLMTSAIPEFELPIHSVNRDISRIEKIGVEIKCNHPIKGEKGIKNLLNDGFDAVLIATGTSAKWRGFDGHGWIPGIDSSDVLSAVEFMGRHRAETKVRPGKKYGNTIVLGWGVHALACVRTAIRIGCKSVTWIVPVERDQLQPDPRLAEQAEYEGVNIVVLTRPIGVETENGKISGVKCIDLRLNEPDHTGRKESFPVAGTEKTITCDTLIDAAYFAPDISWEPYSSGPWGTIDVNLDNMSTSHPGVFASGDIVSGPKSVVEAVALAHRAAAGISAFLRGEKSPIGTLSQPARISGWAMEDPAKLPSKIFRPKVRPVEERSNDFNEAELSFTMWEATHEARRCLLCGPCEECAVCVPSCDRKRAVSYDEKGNPLVVRLPVAVARAISEEAPRPGGEKIEIFIARVDLERCRGCGVCEEICEYHAPRVAPDRDGNFVSTIDVTACKGCGTCVSACPTGAIDQGVTSLVKIRDAISGGVK